MLLLFSDVVHVGEICKPKWPDMFEMTDVDFVSPPPPVELLFSLCLLPLELVLWCVLIWLSVVCVFSYQLVCLCCVSCVCYLCGSGDCFLFESYCIGFFCWLIHVSSSKECVCCIITHPFHFLGVSL